MINWTTEMDSTYDGIKKKFNGIVLRVYDDGSYQMYSENTRNGCYGYSFESNLTECLDDFEKNLSEHIERLKKDLETVREMKKNAEADNGTTDAEQ